MASQRLSPASSASMLHQRDDGPKTLADLRLVATERMMAIREQRLQLEKENAATKNRCFDHDHKSSSLRRSMHEIEEGRRLVSVVGCENPGAMAQYAPKLKGTLPPDPFYEAQAEKVREKYIDLAHEQGKALSSKSSSVGSTAPRRPSTLGRAVASSAVHHCSLPEVRPSLLKSGSRTFQTETASLMAKDGRLNERAQRSSIKGLSSSAASLGLAM